MARNGSGVFERLYSWVTDRNNSIDIDSTRMDAEMNGMATGLTESIARDGQTTITANLPMATYKHTGVGASNSRTDYADTASVQDSSFTYAADSGAANAYVITLAPAITAYAAGQEFCFKAANANTAGSTLNVNGLGVKTIVKNVNENLDAGDIQANAIVKVVYNGTAFQVVGVMPQSGTFTPAIADNNLSAAEAGHTARAGGYWVHNNLCHAWGRINASKGTLNATDNVYIIDLPFTASSDSTFNNTGYPVTFGFYTNFGVDTLQGLMIGGNDYFQLYYTSSGSTTALKVSDLTSAMVIYFQVDYPI